MAEHKRAGISAHSNFQRVHYSRRAVNLTHRSERPHHSLKLSSLPASVRKVLPRAEFFWWNDDTERTNSCSILSKLSVQRHTVYYAIIALHVAWHVGMLYISVGFARYLAAVRKEYCEISSHRFRRKSWKGPMDTGRRNIK
jgi:hypothetical protein